MSNLNFAIMSSFLYNKMQKKFNLKILTFEFKDDIIALSKERKKQI